MLGTRTRAAGWKAQTNLLCYRCTPATFYSNICGQSYKGPTIVNYVSRVVPD